jgi:hypothetical protein
MDQIVSRALGNPRFAAIVFGMFGLVALALAALGVYGLLAYAVTCRTQEIGVRMALGARVADVLGAVLGSTIRLTLAGIAIVLPSRTANPVPRNSNAGERAGSKVPTATTEGLTCAIVSAAPAPFACGATMARTTASATTLRVNDAPGPGRRHQRAVSERPRSCAQ